MVTELAEVQFRQEVGMGKHPCCHVLKVNWYELHSPAKIQFFSLAETKNRAAECSPVFIFRRFFLPQFLYFFIRITALVPPKPKELFMAMFTCILRAVFGT